MHTRNHNNANKPMLVSWVYTSVNAVWLHQTIHRLHYACVLIIRHTHIRTRQQNNVHTKPAIVSSVICATITCNKVKVKVMVQLLREADIKEKLPDSIEPVFINQSINNQLSIHVNIITIHTATARQLISIFIMRASPDWSQPIAVSVSQQIMSPTTRLKTKQ